MSERIDWLRMPPFAIVYFVGRFFADMISQAPMMAAGVVAVISTPIPFPVFAIGLFVVAVAVAAISYWSFSYVQEQDRFLLRRGVFARERVELPFTKVQNINIKQPFYYRPFNLVVLSIDSAGSAQKEVEIAALTYRDAESIKDIILRYRDNMGGAEIDDSATSNGKPKNFEGTLLTRRSVGDIVIHGFTNNRAWILLFALVPFIQQFNRIGMDWLAANNVDVQGWLQAYSWTSVTFFLIVALFGLFILLSLLSVFGSVVAFFDYRLSFHRGTYIRKSGLFNRYEIRIRQSRVQTVLCTQTWLDVLFSRMNVSFEPFSAGGDQAPRRQFMQKIMVPSLKVHEAHDLVHRQCPGLNLLQVKYQAIHPLYMVHKILIFALPASIGSAFIIGGQLMVMILAGSATFVAFCTFIGLRWQRYGVAFSNGYILLRTGFVGQTLYCVPVNKIQQLSLIQSVFMRRREITGLQVVTASRTVFLPYINDTFANQLLDRALAEVESSGVSWM